MWVVLGVKLKAQQSWLLDVCQYIDNLGSTSSPSERALLLPATLPATLPVRLPATLPVGKKISYNWFLVKKERELNNKNNGYLLYCDLFAILNRHISENQQKTFFAPRTTRSWPLTQWYKPLFVKCARAFRLCPFPYHANWGTNLPFSRAVLPVLPPPLARLESWQVHSYLVK